MPDYTWISNLLREIQTFAEANKLSQLASHLVAAQETIQSQEGAHEGFNSSLMRFEQQLEEKSFKKYGKPKSNILRFPDLLLNRR